MRNGPPVPTSVPVHTPLEAVHDPAVASPAGQKTFAVTLSLAPPIVPGAKLTALVPPTQQRVAIVVPASVHNSSLPAARSSLGQALFPGHPTLVLE